MNTNIDNEAIYENNKRIILFWVSVLQLFSFIILIVCISNVFKNSIHINLDKDDYLLPGKDQAIRAWGMFFGTIFFVTTIIIFWKSFYLERSKLKVFLISSISLFSFINCFLIAWKFKNDGSFKLWFNSSKQRNNFYYIFSIYMFFKVLFNKTSIPKKRLWINILAYLTLLSCLFVFSLNMILYNKESSNIFNLENYYIFAKWTYFTQLSNTLCLIYLVFFFIFKNYKIASSSNIKILICSYIIVVSTVYVCILFPGNFMLDMDHSSNWFNVASTMMQHVVVPILFCSFMTLMMKKEKVKPIPLFKLILKGLVFPTWYSIYVYSLSFVCRFSPYYIITNMNPNMSLQGTSAFGSYINVLFYIPMMIYFSIWIFAFWSIDMKYLSISKIQKIRLRNYLWK